MKKLFIMLLILSSLAAFTRCHGSDRKENPKAEELAGIFSGSAGYLSFFPGKKVLVSFSDEYVWLLNGRENNHTYGYVFILGNEEISYDKAEAFYLHDGDTTFAMISCLTDKDNITLLPGDQRKTAFERQTE